MMIRKQTNGGLTLIPMTEHSKFVGQLAAHWGNERFAPLEPYESVVRAATYHDFAFLNWDPDLPLNPAGEPRDLFNIPTAARQVDAYQWSIDWLTGIDTYSGLLVSMHLTGLRRGRYGTITYPAAFNPRSQNELMESFIASNEARQKQAKTAVDEARLQVNYHLLQVWDLLGLYFGCSEPADDRIEPVPTGYAPDSPRVTLRMKALGGNRVAFDPFPFTRKGLKVQMTYKRLAQARFPDEPSYRKAINQAPVEMLEYELV